MPVKDTIGAGDAFTATLTHYYLRGAPLRAISTAANRMGAWVSTQAGATTVVDGTNNSVLGTMKTGKGPFAIAVNPKSHTAVALGLDGGLTVARFADDLHVKFSVNQSLETVSNDLVIIGDDNS